MPDVKSLAGNGEVGKLVQIIPTISMPRAGSRVSCPKVNPHDLSGAADIKPLWTELAGEAIMIESQVWYWWGVRGGLPPSSSLGGIH